MFFANWLCRVQRGFSGNRARRCRRGSVTPTRVEVLDVRMVMSANAVSTVSAEAVVVSTEQEPVDVAISLNRNQSLVIKAEHGNLAVLIDGLPDPRFANIPANRVHSITVFGGNGNNRIDLSRVSKGEFTGLTGTFRFGGSRFQVVGDASFHPHRIVMGDISIDPFGIEVHGGDGNDTIIGSPFCDSVYGGGGKDVLQGGSGDDELHGSDGKDVLCGDEGKDTLYGERGDDTLKGGSGDDFLDGDTQLIGEGITQFYSGKDLLLGGAGNDYLSAGAGDDIVRGGEGNDTLDGHLGNDLLYGGNGDDALFGGSGVDRLRGMSGNDTLSGGLGNDQLDGGHGMDRVQEVANVNFRLTRSQLTGVGADYLMSIEEAELCGGASDNRIDASRFAGQVTLEGGKGNDTLLGGSKDDVLYGTTFGERAFGRHHDGNDVLNGGGGNDELHGGWGNDTLNGGIGDDWLDGGDGADSLKGEKGRDILISNDYTDTLIGGADADEFFCRLTFVPMPEDLSLEDRVTYLRPIESANRTASDSGDPRGVKVGVDWTFFAQTLDVLRVEEAIERIEAEGLVAHHAVFGSPPGLYEYIQIQNADDNLIFPAKYELKVQDGIVHFTPLEFVYV